MGSHASDPFVAVDVSTDLRALARPLHRIRQAGDELDGALQWAVSAGPPAQLWTWLRDDPRALAQFVRPPIANEPRRPLAAARLWSLQAGW